MPDYIRTVGPFTDRGIAPSEQERLDLCFSVNTGVKAGLSVTAAVTAVVETFRTDEGKKLDRQDKRKAIKTAYRNYYRWVPAILNMTDHEYQLRTAFAEISLVDPTMPRLNEVEVRERHGAAPIPPLLAPGKKRGRPAKNAS